MLIALVALASCPARSAAVDGDHQHDLDTLAHQRGWLLLGHWRKTLFGYLSEADGPAFFLANDGKRDPLSELRATLEAFRRPLDPGQDEKTHAQCRFLARRQWLAAQNALAGLTLLPCADYQAWKKRLDADGVSVMFASAYMGNAASMFGHTFLKFHGRANRGDRDLLNYGVNFFARTGNESSVPYALFGLLGLYPGLFNLSPFHETLKDYANLEGRDVWEYRLNLDADEVDQLVNHLIELQQTYFDYYFLDENCSYQLLAVLEVARNDLHLTDRFFYEVIPADTIRRLMRTPSLVTSIRYRPSLAAVFRANLGALDSGDQVTARHLAPAAASDLASVRAELDSLSPVRRARVLDAAIAYADLLLAKGDASMRDRGHQLKIWRAQTEVDLEPLAPAEPSRPEEGHDPAGVGVSVGRREQQSLTDVSFRMAYHHLLSDDTGFSRNTQLEIMRITARFMNSQAYLQDWTILDLISLPTADRFLATPSWRAGLAIRRLADRPESEPVAGSANGGIGYTVEPWGEALSLSSIVQAHGDVGSGLEGSYRAGLSLQAQLILHPLRPLKLALGTETRHYLLGERTSFPSHWVRASYAATRDLELRSEWSQVNGRDDARVTAFVQFLL